LGDLERDAGNLDRAHDLLMRSAELTRASGDRALTLGTLHSLADLALDAGDMHRAASLYREVLEDAFGAGDGRAAGYCLAGLASVAAAERDGERAGRLWGAVETLEQTLGLRLLAIERARYERRLTSLDAAAVATGRSMTLAQAVEEALSS